ncbi:MAG: thioredoxin fold domain-containing protein [Gammaproteobacteria bacterium]
MNKTIKLLLIIGLMSLPQALPAGENRWFNTEQVKQGNLLFQQNCAVCHGANAELTANWKQKSIDGKYPPPPLNGSAHTWHHPLDQLKKTIQQGGVQIGGLMPPFSALLNEAEMDAVIAYFQSKWPDQTYAKWADRFEVAATDPGQPDITQLLKLRLGINELVTPVETEVKGVYQTRFGNKFAYLIENGRYVFIGDMVDLQNGRNLTELSRREVVNQELSVVPASSLAVFPALASEKTILNVFTDTSCPYCRKLHEEIGFLQEAGITVRYFPYPRGGSKGPGYQTLKQVWCADDKAEAMSIAKGTKVGDLPDTSDCAEASFVDEGFEMGKRLGITGTPSLFTEDGGRIVGYMPYKELIPKLLNNL